MTDPTPDPTQGTTSDSGSESNSPSPTSSSHYTYPGSAPFAAAPGVPRRRPPVPDPAAVGGGADVGVGVGLSDEGLPARRPGGRRTGLPGRRRRGAALGGGAVFAVQQPSRQRRPASRCAPRDAYGYMRLDIDPSAGQKIAAVRFLDKPATGARHPRKRRPRKELWDLVAQEAADDCIAAFDYDKDIAPWLGDRAGGAHPLGGSEDTLFTRCVAVQVTDEIKAKVMLGKPFAWGQGRRRHRDQGRLRPRHAARHGQGHDGRHRQGHPRYQHHLRRT